MEAAGAVNFLALDDLPVGHEGEPLTRLTVRPERPGDDVVDWGLILVWTDAERRIITGSDLLGRLLRRIARPMAADSSKVPT